jgi:predicted dehydrogenase
MQTASAPPVKSQSRGPGTLRLGVIGLGWASRELHLPALRRTQAFEIAATADPSPGLKADFTGYHEMLARTACDAVLIATPPALHLAAARAAFNAGCHVLLEKPIAATLADSLAIRDAALAAGRICALGFNQRCHPALARLRRRIAEGGLGEVRSIHAIWMTRSGYSARSWLGRREEGGGALLDLGSHQIDLWRFLLGSDPAEVIAHAESSMLDDEAADLEARFPGGVTATAHLSLVGGDRYEITVTGSRGSVTVRPYGRDFRASYDEQWRVFARAIASSTPPAATAADGIASLQPLLAAARELPVAPRPEAPAIRHPLSVVLSTPRDYASIRATVIHLGRQSAASRIELILVGPDANSLECPPAEAAPFAAVQRVALGRFGSIAQAYVCGVRHAHGRVVAFSEDHCFPDPGWAEALLQAHEEPCAAVGPVVRNGNPDSLVSWADFLIGYGPWMEPLPAGPQPILPGHNSSYKREALLELGGRLELMLESEAVLHYEWTSRGVPLLLAPGARVAHINYSRWRSWLPVQFLAGRLFGGVRAASWPRPRRFFYAAASPLIPAVRFWRAARSFLRAGRSPLLFARVAPTLAIGLLLDGAGQMCGYLSGPGNSVNALAKYEYNRIDHVRERDRDLWRLP